MNGTKSRLMIFILVVPLFAMCASSSRKATDSSDSGLIRKLREIPPWSASTPTTQSEDPQFEAAQQFHRLLQGDLEKEQEQSLIKGCKRNSKSHPFCFSISRINVLRARQKKPISTRVETEKKTITPMIPTFANGKVTNWRQLRRANVSSLLEGLTKISPEEMEILRKQAAVERYCPNRIAIAVAAQLEDTFPKLEYAEPIADLYAKASGCTKRRSRDKEHFLTRAGLLYYVAGNYKRSEAVLRQVHPTDAYVGRAWYWLYRARKQLGSSKANDTLQRLLRKHPFSFHALLASIESGLNPKEVLLGKDGEMQKRSKRSNQTNQIIEEVEILGKFGFSSSAHFLVRWASDRSRLIEPSVRIYLATLGSPYYAVTRLPGLFIRSPKMASFSNMQIAYPLAFADIFQENDQGVDPLLLYSIARKESKFDPHATSRADAQGLLQIHPDTAARLTDNMKLDLLNPQVSVTLAAFYLNRLFQRMNGSLHWVIASYNAGETAAESWIRRFGSLEPVLAMDLITYRETRTYVSMVLSNYYWYRALHAPEKKSPIDYLVRSQELARKPDMKDLEETPSEVSTRQEKGVITDEGFYNPPENLPQDPTLD